MHMDGNNSPWRCLLDIHLDTSFICFIKFPVNFRPVSVLFGCVIRTPKTSIYLELSRLHKDRLCGCQVVLVVIFAHLGLYVKVSIYLYIRKRKQPTPINQSVDAALWKKPVSVFFFRFNLVKVDHHTSLQPNAVFSDPQGISTPQKKRQFRLRNYSIINRLEVLKKLGNILRININGDMEAESWFRPHFEGIAVVEIVVIGFRTHFPGSMLLINSSLYQANAQVRDEPWWRLICSTVTPELR